MPKSLAVIGLFAALAACALLPADEEPPEVPTMAFGGASIAIPPECMPSPRSRGGVGCAWEAPSGRRYILTLDSSALPTADVGLSDAALLATLSAADPEISARILESAVAGFERQLRATPGFLGVTFSPVSPRARPPGAAACSRYTYGQRLDGLLGAPAQALEVRGHGMLCTVHELATPAVRLVIAEINESWSPTLEQTEGPDTAAVAARLLATLRVG